MTSHIKTLHVLLQARASFPLTPPSGCVSSASLSPSVSRGQEQGPISLFVVKLKQFYTTWPRRSVSARPPRRADMQPSGSKEPRSASCRLGINAMETMTSSVVLCVMQWCSLERSFGGRSSPSGSYAHKRTALLTEDVLTTPSLFLRPSNVALHDMQCGLCTGVVVYSDVWHCRANLRRLRTQTHCAQCLYLTCSPLRCFQKQRSAMRNIS